MSSRKLVFMCRVLCVVAFPLVLASALMFPSNADAASYTWWGSTGNWNDPFQWTGGPEGTVPGAGDTATINSGEVRLTASETTIGTLNWNGGTIADNSANSADAMLTVNTAFNISGDTQKSLRLNSSDKWLYIKSQGTATWSGSGAIERNGGSTGKIVFVNHGAFNIQNDTYFRIDQFLNFADKTMTKQTGTGTSSIYGRVDNSGKIAAQSGKLVLSGGGQNTAGTFDCAAAGVIQLEGVFDATTGVTFSGAGRTMVGGGSNSGRLRFSSTSALATVTGTLELRGDVEGGTLNVKGTLDWVGGSMKGPGTTVIESGAKLILKGGALDVGRVLNNSGTTTWPSGFPRLYGGAIFNNKTGGNFVIESADSYSGATDTAFNNEVGAIVTSNVFALDGIATTTLGMPFNNKGLVNCQRGNLKISGGGSSTGTFSAASGATVLFPQSSFLDPFYTFSSGTKLTGAGVFENGGGTVHVAPGATVECEATYLLDTFSTLKVNFGGVFNVKGNFVMRGGTLDGSGTFNVSGEVTWFEGTMKGTGGETNILAGGKIHVSDTGPQGSDFPSNMLDTRNINNSGTFTIDGTHSFGDFFKMTNGANFTNKSGGVVNLLNDGYFDNYNSSGGIFDNQAGAVINCNVHSGEFLEAGGVGVSFLNNGTVNVQKGTFYVAGGGNSVGKFNVSTGATLFFELDNFIANAGTTVIGAGSTVMDGNFTIPSGATLTIPAGHALLLNGLLDGSGNLTVDGALDWQGGIMQGGGITRISAGATATFSAGEFDQSKDLVNRTINNFGTITWTGDNINMGNDAEINNESGANFIINTDRAFTVFNTADPQAIFANKAGATFTKSGGSSTQIWSAPFTNAGSVILQTGTLNFQYFTGNYVQTAGFTNLLGGNLSSTQSNGVRSTIDIQGGTVTGVGTINADLDNNGRLQPGQTAGIPGVLAISGNYTQTANGKLDIEIGGPSAGTQYDQLQTGGNASLDGLLTIVHLNNFVPSLSDTFLVMTYASRSGSFSLSGMDYGMLVLKPIYNTTNLTLVPKQRTIGIDNAFVTEGTGGAVTAKFTVFLSDASGQSITVDFTTANGSATTPADYIATSGTVTINPGLKSQTISVVVQGDALDEDDETFFVNLSNPSGAVFEDDQAECDIVDNDAAPTLSIRDLSVAEGASGFTNAPFSVVLSAPSGKEIKVNFASIDGSALAPGDYTAVSGTLVFAAGTTTRTINVPIKGDLLDEPNETFRINLSTPVNTSITDNQALGTIRDDDPTPALAINNVTLIEGHTGTKNAAFTVTLSAPSGQTVSVSAITSDGTARAPADYTATGIRLTFTPGQVSKIVNIPVKGDVLDEVNETFFVVLSSPVNAGIGVGRGTGTITDDDAPPTIFIDDLSVKEYNAGQTTAALRLRLSAPSGQIVRVSYATANGTANPATAGTDYVAVAPTQVAFSAGNLYAYARVLINGDELNEANETFLVNLSSPVNATITDNQGIGTILNDDATPSLAINDVSIAEGNAGTRTLTFTVTLSKASGQTVSVNFASADGTARSTSDYVAQSGTLSFTPGSALTRTISIVINGDTLVESDETFAVLLSGVINASISKARGVGTITNDDVSG